MDFFEELTKLKELLDSGAITQEEYDAMKKQAIIKKNTEQSTTKNEDPATLVVQTTSSSNTAATSGEGTSTVNKVIIFLLPIIGLIMYFLHKAEKPVAAKQELMWFIGSFVFWFIIFSIF